MPAICIKQASVLNRRPTKWQGPAAYDTSVYKYKSSQPEALQPIPDISGTAGCASPCWWQVATHALCVLADARQSLCCKRCTSAQHWGHMSSDIWTHCLYWCSIGFTCQVTSDRLSMTASWLWKALSALLTDCTVVSDERQPKASYVCCFMHVHQAAIQISSQTLSEGQLTYDWSSCSTYHYHLLWCC